MEYVYVCETTDVPAESIRLVEGVGRVPTCLVNTGGKYFAVSGICPHKRGCLWEGELKNGHIKCPIHTAHFRLEDGCHSWPSPRGLRTFPVKVESNSIYIGVQPTHR